MKLTVAMASTGASLFLSLSSASAQTPPPDPPAPGVLEAAGRIYEFVPDPCAIHVEDGVLDIEVGGLGTTPDGQPFYFSLTSTGNELELQLGADGPFATSEQSLRAGQYVSQPFEIEESERVISIPSLVLVDEAGATVDEEASLMIDCRADPNGKARE